LERWLMLLENVPTVFDTDALRPLIAIAESLTGQHYQAGEGGRTDTSLRVLADHARSMTFLVNDGVVPANAARGYVVGSVIRHAAFRLHDTFGFPIELTEELAEERGVAVDRGGFDAAMREQRQRAKAARKVTTLTEGGDAFYRELVAEHGTTEFTGYAEYETKA